MKSRQSAKARTKKLVIDRKTKKAIEDLNTFTDVFIPGKCKNLVEKIEATRKIFSVHEITGEYTHFRLKGY